MGFKESLLAVAESNKEFMVIIGQLQNPVEKTKQDQSGKYIAFDLKVVSQSTENAYNTSFSTYHLIIPAAQTEQYRETIRKCKGNEVAVIAKVAGRVKKSEQGARYNSINLYMQEIFLVRELTTLKTSDVQAL